MAPSGTSSGRRRAGAVATYAYLAAQVVVSLLYVPLLLEAIGREEYGLYQIVGSIMAWLGVMNTTLSAGATRFYARCLVLGDEEGMANVLGELRRAYRRVAAVVVAATACLVPVVRIAYQGSFTAAELDESCWMLALLAVNLLVTMGSTVSVAAIAAHERFVFLKGTMAAALMAQLAVVVLAVRAWPSAVTVCAAQLATNAACCAAQRLYARRRLGMDDRLRRHSDALERQLMSFSGTVVLALVADQVFWKTDQLVLGWMYGAGATAAYAVGMQVVSAYMALGSAVSSVFLPRVSELWDRDHDLGAVSALFVRVSRTALYPLLAVLLGFATFGREFVGLWAGPGYDEAYWVALVVMVPLTVDVAQNLGLTILQVMGRYGYRARMYMAAAAANVVGTLVLARLWGGYGAAASSAVAVALSSGVALNRYYAREVGLCMRRWWASCLRLAMPLVGMTAAFAALWGAVPHPATWGVLALGMLAYAAAFVAVAWTLSANGYERGLVRGVAGRLVRGARTWAHGAQGEAMQQTSKGTEQQ